MVYTAGPVPDPRFRFSYFCRMEHLWSPWRSQFIDTHEDEPKDESPFLKAWNQPDRDEENLLFHRGERAFIILNKFPYNPGHLLIVPVSQVADLLELEPAERNEMMDLVAYGIDVLKRALNPHGFNVGMNLGRTAGAAIDSHVHIHVVPRWNGDTNFMPTLNETKVMSHGLEEIYRRLVDSR